MPISPIILQRRHAELGRIRLGSKGDRGQPKKLSQFRFTSPSEAYIRDLAELYGGTPQPWDNKGKAEWEVFTTATTMPVIAVKGGLSQWMETWTGGGCVHRCDGEVDVLTGDRCDDGDPNHRNAKPTTRLSVMLPELDAIGVWRLESHGWNAAAEIPAVAELAQHVGDLVPAVLHLVERRSVRDGKTSRFVVPVLDLRIGASRLRELAAQQSGLTQLAAPASAAAIEGPRRDFQAEAEDLTDLDALRALWRDAVAAGQLTPELRTYLTVRSKELAPSAAHEEEPVEGEIVPDSPAGTPSASSADPDAIWQQIVTEGGRRGYTTTQLRDEFASNMGGLLAEDASAAELAHFLNMLREQPATDEAVPA